jgi:hypothetical protein
VLNKKGNLIEMVKNGVFEMRFEDIKRINLIYIYILIGLILIIGLGFIWIERLYENEQINLFSIFLTLE